MNKTMKKILCLILALATLVCFATGCSNDADEQTEENTEAVVEETTEDAAEGETEAKVYKVGICQLVQHVALDAATQGFKDALTEKLGDQVVFDEQNASGEATNCTTIVSQFVSNEVDLIMANATGALTAASEATETIPVVATSITDYATALGIKDWTGTTGFNVTGTSDLGPLDKQAEMVLELVPDAKTVGILYCSSEPNSKYQATEVTAYLKNLGVETVKEYTFVDTNDVTAVTQQAADECDVIYVPTDNTVASNTEAINNIAEPAGVPIIAGESGICTGCGVATLSIDYYDIGYRTGEMAYEILVNGADPAEMPIEYADESEKQYMADRAATLNITIPEGYTAIGE